MIPKIHTNYLHMTLTEIPILKFYFIDLVVFQWQLFFSEIFFLFRNIINIYMEFYIITIIKYDIDRKRFIWKLNYVK